MKWLGPIILLLFPLFAACTNTPTLSMGKSPTLMPAKPADTLNIYSQEQAIDPATLANFENRFGVKVHYTTAAEDESGLADLQAGLTNYDLVILNDLQVGSLRAESIFVPLNKENIPNFKNIDPAFLSPLFDPGNRYCVPYQWGTLGLGYNLKRTGKEIQNWADFFKSNSPLRLGLPADSRLALGAALLYLGYSPNTSNSQEIGTASELWRNHAGPIVIYTPAQGVRSLAEGQVDLIFARNRAILPLMANQPDLRYAIPGEGSLLWWDNVCLLAQAANPALAETFINYLLDAQIAAALANATHAGLPNQAALPLLNPADLADPALYPDDQLRQRLFFLVNVDPITDELYEQAWAGSVSQTTPGSN